MTINTTPSPIAPQLGLTPAAPSAATGHAPATAPALPQALEGLMGRRAGPDKLEGAPRRHLRAELPVKHTPAALVRPYEFEHAVSGSSKTLIPLGAALWKGHDAQLAAHRIVLEAVQSHMAKQLAQRGTAPPAGSALEKFSAGKLDHVYADAGSFKDLATAAGRSDKSPVYVDIAHNQLVVNVDKAFVVNDQLSPAAEQGLSAALGLGKNGLDFLPRYQGHAVSSRTKGADFFKANTHAQLHGEKPDASAFTHSRYFEAENTKALGKEIVVHRGMFDNRNGIPENSLAAIDNAYKAGYRSLEIDIQVTKDGVPVLLHDFTIGRMTADDKDRLVSHVDWNELRNKPLVIRNPVDGNFVETDQKVASVKEALLDIARTKPDMAIALDCKEQTAEAAFDLLKNEPELRKFTALKLYAKAYPGGFDQFLGNLYERYNIDPKHPEDRAKRQELLQTLKGIKVEPVFSAGVVTDPTIHALHPATTAKGQNSAEGAAESAMAWIQGWRAMDIKVLEAPPSDANPLQKQAMDLLRQRLAQPESGLSHVASSAAYRSEDFSVPQQDGSRKFFTNQIFGLMKDVTNDPVAAQSETAGTLRHAGENVLTDQPQEEVFATVHDKALARGHSGLVLAVPPGTTIDATRNKEIVDLRVQVFGVEKPKVDAGRIAAVREGLAADKAAAAAPQEPGTSNPAWVAAPSVLAVGVAAGAAYAMVKRGSRAAR